MTLHAHSNPQAMRDAAIVRAIESMPKTGYQTPDFQKITGDKNRDNVRFIMEKLVKHGVLTSEKPHLRCTIYYKVSNWRDMLDDYFAKRDASLRRSKVEQELHGGPMVKHAIKSLPVLHRIWA